MHGIGAACCGSLGQAICFDDSTMCDNDSDFNGEAVVSGDLDCTALAAHLSSKYDVFSWDDVACTASYTGDDGTTESLFQDLQVYGAGCCGSLAKTRCFDGGNMCKFDGDFNPSANVATVSVDGTDHLLQCGGESGVATQALAVLRVATGRDVPSAEWSDLTCADMTTNLTAHFVSEYFQHLYLKSTMRDFFETYGVGCCGSLGKTRDPCEVCLSTQR